MPISGIKTVKRMPQRKAYQAILEGRCPKCREGKLFKFPLRDIFHFTKMHRECLHCGLRFEVEPGFFFGAMYISYAATIAILVATGVILSIIEKYELTNFVITATAITILLMPIIFRYSRILFLFWFGGVKYNPDLVKD